MRNYTYHSEISILLEQFCDVFNDIIIKNYDNSSQVIPGQDNIKVNFVYAPKTRIYESLINPAPGGVAVPIISVSLGGIRRDKSRVFNKIHGFNVPFIYPNQDERLSKPIRQPVPIDITVNMTIITKFQEHMDQILTNFIPYCDPYVAFSWKMPGLRTPNEEIEIRTQVIWNENVTLDYPKELAASQHARLSAETSFTIKGWMFKSMEETVKKIYFIDADFKPVNKSTILLSSEDLENETISISACPVIKSVAPYKIPSFFTPELSAHNNFNVGLYGKYFFSPRNLYLSASNPAMFNDIQEFNPFISVPNLSATNPSFSGIVVPEFSLLSDQYIEFVLPQQPQVSGFVDVIVENEAGYGKLTTGSFNHSLSSYPGFLGEQPPYASGINISPVF